MKFFRNHILLSRAICMLTILTILIVGQAITIPGVDASIARKVLEKQTYLQLLGVAVGGQFTIPTIFSLGLAPYMTSLIIWQMITALDLDTINRLSLNQSGYIKKMLTLVIACLQVYPMVQLIRPSLRGFTFNGYKFNTAAIALGIGLILVAGAMLTVFLGDINDQKGLGGISILILPGVLTAIPRLLMDGWNSAFYKLTPNHIMIAIIVAIVTVIVLVMLMQIEIRIIIQRTLMEGSGNKSYLPFKLLVAGAMPFMFSATIFMLPRGVILNSYSMRHTAFAKIVLLLTNQQSWWGILTYGIVILFLTYVFGFITIQPFRLSKQMKENNEYVLGVFPGEKTSAYLIKKFIIISTIGGIILAMIAVIPLIIGLKYAAIANYTLYIGNISILVGLIKVLWDQITALYNKNRYRIFEEK